MNVFLPIPGPARCAETVRGTGGWERCHREDIGGHEHHAAGRAWQGRYGDGTARKLRFVPCDSACMFPALVLPWSGVTGPGSYRAAARAVASASARQASGLA